jgi:hypothetical protein
MQGVFNFDAYTRLINNSLTVIHNTKETAPALNDDNFFFVVNCGIVPQEQLHRERQARVNRLELT